MPLAYSVRDWDKNFEVAQSRRSVGPLAWVGVPTKHDGKSYRRLIRLPNGPALFAGWILIVQIAAKCPVRGVLADADGPLSADDMAEKTGAPAGTFADALEILSSEPIGWLKRIDLSEIAQPPPIALGGVSDCSAPTEPVHNRTEQTGAGLGGGKNLENGNGFLPLDRVYPHHLESVSDMERLQHRLSTTAPGFLPEGDRGLLMLVSAAVRAKQVGNKPVALFVSIVKGERWGLITEAQRNAARERIANHRGTKDAS